MWTDEARQASAAARNQRAATPIKRMGFGIVPGGQFSGKQLGNNQPTSAGARAVSDLRAAMALSQGHPKSVVTGR